MSLSKIIYFLWVQNILKSVLSTLGSYFWSLRLQHLESVLKYRLLGHTSRISNSLGLWWGRGTCISYIFSGDVDAENQYTRSRFSNLCTVDSLAQIILCQDWGNCRMFNRVLGLYSLDASCTPSPIMTIKNVSRYCHMSPGGQNISK